MELKYILSAKRMSDIKATSDDVKAALSANPLAGISVEEISDTLYVKKSDGLPRFEGRKLFEKKKKFGETADTYHVAGPILFVSNIPAGVKEWQPVKDALQEHAKVCWTLKMLMCFSYVFASFLQFRTEEVASFGRQNLLKASLT